MIVIINIKNQTSFINLPNKGLQMKSITYLINCFILTCLSLTAMGETNPLSVHVLNLQTGLPSSNVEVVLEQKNGDNWKLLNKGITDNNGRITVLFPSKETMEEGIYKVTFKTEKWFKAHNIETFFPEVPVIFKADTNTKHYHIPLLISPYGYSTYRGN